MEQRRVRPGPLLVVTSQDYYFRVSLKTHGEIEGNSIFGNYPLNSPFS
jgi:hypothetical protein